MIKKLIGVCKICNQPIVVYCMNYGDYLLCSPNYVEVNSSYICNMCFNEIIEKNKYYLKKILN